MIYIVGWLSIYCALAVGWLTGYRGRMFAVLSILFLGVIAICRGNVGTDTANYEGMVDVAQHIENWGGVELGFSALGWLLVNVFDSEVIAVRMIAVIFVLGLLCYIQRANRDEIFFLLTYFIPTFFYQYSMNALRIGLASLVLLFSAQAWGRRHELKGMSIGVGAMAFHYSALVSLLFMITATKNWLSCRYVLLAFGFLVIGGVGFYVNADYMLAKIALYDAHKSPHVLSGLRIIVVCSVIAFGVALSKLPRQYKLRLILFAIFTGLLFWGFAQISYAGLRLLDLLWLAFPLSVLIVHGQLGIALNWKMKASFSIGGVVAAVATFLGFLGSQGIGATPFLPYEWFW